MPPACPKCVEHMPKWLQFNTVLVIVLLGLFHSLAKFIHHHCRRKSPAKVVGSAPAPNDCSLFAAASTASVFLLGIRKHLHTSHKIYDSMGRTELEKVSFLERRVIQEFRGETLIAESGDDLSGARILQQIAIVEYAPKVFHELRKLRGLSGLDVARSFGGIKRANMKSCDDAECEELLSKAHFDAQQDRSEANKMSTPKGEECAQDMQKSKGKSSAMFIPSNDTRFILKTLTSSELSVVLRILKSYFEHLRANPNSLLPWFLGLYSLDKGKNQPSVVAILMENIFCTNDGVVVDEQYDLKGSTINRTVGMSKIGMSGVTYKDLDWLEFGNKVFLPPKANRSLLQQLSLDTEFLESWNLMDYSLLLGIRRECLEKNTNTPLITFPKKIRETCLSYLHGKKWSDRKARVKREPLHKQDAGGIASVAEDAIYFLGLVDILQLWNMRKRVEQNLKRVAHFSTAVEPTFSCTDPKNYRTRMMKFLEKDVLVSSIGEQKPDF